MIGVRPAEERQEINGVEDEEAREEEVLEEECVDAVPARAPLAARRIVSTAANMT